MGRNLLVWLILLIHRGGGKWGCVGHLNKQDMLWGRGLGPDKTGSRACLEWGRTLEEGTLALMCHVKWKMIASANSSHVKPDWMCVRERRSVRVCMREMKCVCVCVYERWSVCVCDFCVFFFVRLFVSECLQTHHFQWNTKKKLFLWVWLPIYLTSFLYQASKCDSRFWATLCPARGQCNMPDLNPPRLFHHPPGKQTMITWK